MVLCVGLSMAALAMAGQARATLGESADSVASDRLKESIMDGS